MDSELTTRNQWRTRLADNFIGWKELSTSKDNSATNTHKSELIHYQAVYPFQRHQYQSSQCYDVHLLPRF